MFLSPVLEFWIVMGLFYWRCLWLLSLPIDDGTETGMYQ